MITTFEMTDLATPAGTCARWTLTAGIAFAAAAALCTPANAGLINPGFEYGQPVDSEADYNDASVNPAGGWFTTETDHQIEVWGSGWVGVPAYEGNNFVELNANAVGTLYQDTSGIATGNVVGYQFAHRGREGDDTMELDITDVTTGTTLFSSQYTDGDTAWGFYSGQFTVGAGVASTDDIRFAYISISAAGGNPTEGNFLDDADFGIGVGTPTPEPATLSLLGTGLFGLTVLRRRKRA
jgi:PEP-CTERM motif